MFFDMEGLPEVNFNYLIGLIIVSDGQTISYSLWIDTIENEKSMVKDFIEVINNL
jgi:predicted RecB family nuclease